MTSCDSEYLNYHQSYVGVLKYILSVITATVDSDSSNLAPAFCISLARVPGISSSLLYLSGLGYN